jgi:RNA polymerase sigma-70 factor, ECF subfamily
MVSPQQVTVLLEEWSHGNQAALNQLIPLVEAELHRLARQYISREHPGHTLQTTALVNEAYIRLVQVHDVHWQNREHFFAISARIMRRIMIEHARKRTVKRDWEFARAWLPQRINGEAPKASDNG